MSCFRVSTVILCWNLMIPLLPIFLVPHPAYVAILFFSLLLSYTVVRHLLILYFVVRHFIATRVLLYVTKFRCYLFAWLCTLRIIRRTVPVPQTPLANKLFVNTRCQPWRPAAWPVPSPVAWGHPNPAHWRHPHTMGEYACAWFGRPPTTARVVGSNRDSKKYVTCWPPQITSAPPIFWLPS